MPWPTLSNYAEAIRDYPHISILDPKLKGGNPRRGSNNYLMVYSGGFSTVFPIEVLSDTYALRCWIADIGAAETRYKEISDYLQQCHLPYFVDFDYVPEGILVNGIRYPITRMEWAEGETLCDFIKSNLQNAGCLKTAAIEFQKMAAALHTHQISHGDLQDGNILFKRSGTDIEIKLIDYDSLFVPALRGQPDSIVGVPAYQHPQRIAGGGRANEKVDYFSELVIYLSLLSLVEKPDLWHQFGATEKRLLFKAEDFKNPDQSDVFRELEKLSPDVKQLASKLKEFCKRPVDQLEPLQSVLPKTSPAQVAYDQGIAYLNNNQYNEAVVEFEKAIGLDPNYKEAHHGIGLAHFKIGDSGEAKRAVEEALRIDSQYQPAIQLLDIIESSTFGTPVSQSTGTSGQTSTNSTSQSPPLTGASGPGGISKPHSVTSNLWQYITGVVAFILLICIVALAMQISEKDEYLRRIEILENQQTETNSRLIDASNEKRRLSFENRRLRNQLTEKDKEIKNQSPTVRQLQREKEELRSQNQNLQNENATLRNQLELDGTTSSVRALSNENAQLRREIGGLQNQLTEQDKKTKVQVAIAKQLRTETEELHSQNRKLQNENTQLRREIGGLQNQLTEQDKKTKVQVAIAKQLRTETEELHSQNRKLQNENATLREQLNEQRPPSPPPRQLRPAPLQKIYHNSVPRVASTAMSKNNQGCIEFDRGKHNRAIQLFEDAINSDSRSAIIHYNLGSAYLAMKEYAKSENYLQKAVIFDPQFKEAYYNLALVYLGQGDQEAKRKAQKSLSIDKNYRLALQLLDYLDR